MYGAQLHALHRRIQRFRWQPEDRRVRVRERHEWWQVVVREHDGLADLLALSRTLADEKRPLGSP
jgi:hypothetical protein